MGSMSKFQQWAVLKAPVCFAALKKWAGTRMCWMLAWLSCLQIPQKLVSQHPLTKRLWRLLRKGSEKN